MQGNTRNPEGSATYPTVGPVQISPEGSHSTLPPEEQCILCFFPDGFVLLTLHQLQLLAACLPLPVLCASPQPCPQNIPHWFPAPTEPHAVFLLAPIGKGYPANMASSNPRVSGKPLLRAQAHRFIPLNVNTARGPHHPDLCHGSPYVTIGGAMGAH